MTAIHTAVPTIFPAVIANPKTPSNINSPAKPPHTTSTRFKAGETSS